MPSYRFDRMSLRGYVITSEHIECADERAAVSVALGALAREPIGHIRIVLEDRVVWWSGSPAAWPE